MPCRAVPCATRIRDVHATSTRERRVIHRFIVAPAHRARARTHDVARVTRMNESRDDVDTSPAPRHRRIDAGSDTTARARPARDARRGAQPFSRIRTFALEHVPRVASTLHTRRNDGWMDAMDAMRCDAMRARASPWWRRCATSVCDARPPVPRRWWWWWTNTVGTRPDERSGRVRSRSHATTLARVARVSSPRRAVPSQRPIASASASASASRASGVRDSSARLTVHDPARARRGRRVSAVVVGSRWVVG